MSTKQNFKYMAKHTISRLMQTARNALGRTKFIHSKLMTLTEADLEEFDSKPKSIYGMLVSWVLDVFQFGIPAEFVFATVTEWPGIMRFFLQAAAFGVGLWLWSYTIKWTIRAMKEK